MRIAQVMEWNFEELGGVQSHVKGLTSHLINQGHYVIAIMKKRLNKVKKQEFSAYYLKAPLPNLVFPVSKVEIFKILKKEKIDLIHIHHVFNPISISAAAAGNKADIPIVFTNHTIFLMNKKYFLEMLFFHKKALNIASKIISVSKAADRVIDVFVKDKKKRAVIPNGVDSGFFIPSKSAPVPNSICFVGRLVSRKGVHVLLKAFSKVKEEIDDARLLIVGDGRSRKGLESLVEKLKVKDVSFTGNVNSSSVLSYYQKSEMVVVPSIDAESFGIVVVEAMACGRPVIVTDDGGLPEIVSDNNDGIIVESGSSETLYRAIKRLLLNKGLAEKLGRNARDKVKRTYDWEIVTRKIIQVYQEFV